MGQPKKRTSSRKTATRRSHHVLKLARRVNASSPVKARTTVREGGNVKPKPEQKVATPAKEPVKTS